MVGNGIAAAAAIAETKPTFAFLDIRMPGIAASTRVVFVTAHDEYAVSAFEAAAADYLLKPVSDARLLQCVSRLARQAPSVFDLNALTAVLGQRPLGRALEWLTVRLADTTRLVPIQEVLYFRSGDKYTEAVTATERHLVRTPLKDLLEQIDPRCFAQIHRSVIVNLRAVERIERDLLGRSSLHLRGHGDVLAVSRSFQDRFKQM
jgi:DNA-binding LytR/AlgR family response regulator